MWVDFYKQDKKGILGKCKVRLVVRGDRENKVDLRDIYAAALVSRSSRTLMAIAAQSDLELKQYIPHPTKLQCCIYLNA
jgi:hypothetical protein